MNRMRNVKTSAKIDKLNIRLKGLAVVAGSANDLVDSLAKETMSALFAHVCDQRETRNITIDDLDLGTINVKKDANSSEISKIVGAKITKLF